jgi:Uma2 family endonuclease
VSVEAYLRFEARSATKHEYVAGEVYAMSGVTRRHAKLAMNVAFRLGNAARGGPCDVMVAEVKVRAGRDRIYYPDVMVACTPGRDTDVLVRDPCLVVEVTSPSTARVDRGEKRDAYLAIPSLRAYLIVDHRYRRVEWHVRDAGDAWRRGETIDTGSVDVPCPAVTLRLDEIYEGVEPMSVREMEAEYATA